MPLVDENRILVRKGLALLRASERNGLRQVFRRKDLLGKRISTTDIAWQVSPLLNSAGRMGEPGTATRVPLAQNTRGGRAARGPALPPGRQAKERWGRARGTWCSRRRRTPWKLRGQVHPRSRRRVSSAASPAIIASRLQGFFKAPAIVMAVGAETAVGSIRSNRQRIIADFFARHGAEFLSFGGHDFAGGFSIERGRLDGFRGRVFRARRGDSRGRRHGWRRRSGIDAEIPAAVSHA